MFKCAIIGAAGFIGSNLTDACLDLGWHVVGVDNFATGHREMVEPSRFNNRGGRFTFFEADINKSLEGVLDGCNVVFLLAALPRVSFSIDHPIEANQTNVHGVLNVLEHARKAQVKRVIFSSSSSMFGGVDQFPTPENVGFAPKSPYALHKMAGTEYCRLYSELHGLDTVNLIYYNVYGPYQRTGGAYSTVIPAFFGAGVNGQSCRIDGDGEQSRDFCISGDDKVLLSNLTWECAKNIKPEMKVVSFDEKPTNKKRFFNTSSVDKVASYIPDELYKISFSNGNEVKCTGNHPWMTYKGFKRTDFLYKRFKQNGKTYDIKSIINNNMTWENYSENICNKYMYDRGYVAGSIEGDGHIGKYVDKRNSNNIHTCSLRVADKEFADYYNVACRNLGIDNHSGDYYSKYPGAKKAYYMRTNKRGNYIKVKEILDNKNFDHKDFSKGYMASIFDGEGEYHRGLLRISNSDQKILENIERVLDMFGFKYSNIVKKNELRYITVLGGLMEHIRFFSTFQNKILRKRPNFSEREVKVFSNSIVDIKKIIPERVFVIEVKDKHTYITNGLLNHNCYVDNVVRANILAAYSDKSFAGDMFNIACGATHSVNSVFDKVSSLLKVNLQRNNAPPRLGDPRKSHADISKACEVLGYEPRVGFNLGLEKTAEWWLSGCPIQHNHKFEI